MIILSLTDLAKSLKRYRVLLFLICVLCGSTAFAYLLTRPLHFTAVGIFKGHAPKPTPLLKAVELLGDDQTYFTNDDPRSFLRSYPVLEAVVRELNLQATLQEKKIGHRIREIWHTLKTARAYSKLKKKKMPARVLSPTVLAADQLIIPDFADSLTCSEVRYSAETACALSLRFFDANAFRVYRNKKELGLGKMGEPFIWDLGCFTLTGKGKKGKICTLYLMPMKEAVESLKDTISVKKDKENASLVHISYTHRDRHLAANIVNETMGQFQNYLQLEGKKKINKQLLYLRQRQDETVETLDTLFRQHQAYLESNLDSKAMITLEKEIEFMAHSQAQKIQEKLQIESEMYSLAHLLWGQNAKSHEELNLYLQQKKQDVHLQTLTLEAAYSLIQSHQKELDQLYLSQELYDDYLVKLSDAHLDCCALAKTLDDLTLRPRFEKIHSLQRILADLENWTEKEREKCKEELEHEKSFLMQHLQHLKEGNVLQAQVIQQRIHSLQQNLIFLLSERYTQIENDLGALYAQNSHFPQKWLHEQKIELNTKLYMEMIESITKMIESKNIGYHLDYLLSSSLQPALAPVVPDHPHLILGAFIGFLLGGILSLFCLAVYHAWSGPSASFENLADQKWQVFSGGEYVQQLGLAISQRGQVVCMISKHKPLITIPLTQWLTNRGEKIFVLDLTTPTLQDGTDLSQDQAFLASESFRRQLNTLKMQYDRIVILSKGSAHCFVTQALILHADTIVYGITQEKLVEIEPLPKTTLFYIQSDSQKMVSLNAIHPLLNELFKRMKIASYFSSAKDAWRRFLLK